MPETGEQSSRRTTETLFCRSPITRRKARARANINKAKTNQRRLGQAPIQLCLMPCAKQKETMLPLTTANRSALPTTSRAVRTHQMPWAAALKVFMCAPARGVEVIILSHMLTAQSFDYTRARKRVPLWHQRAISCPKFLSLGLNLDPPRGPSSTSALKKHATHC